MIRRVVVYVHTQSPEGAKRFDGWEVILLEEPTPEELFLSLFDRSPIIPNENGWRTLSGDQIVKLLLDIAKQIHKIAAQGRYNGILATYIQPESANQGWIVQVRRDLFYPTLSERDVVELIAQMCFAQSRWMNHTIKHPLYAGADMRVFIQKPIDVAKRLLAMGVKGP